MLFVFMFCVCVVRLNIVFFLVYIFGWLVNFLVFGLSDGYGCLMVGCDWVDLDCFRMILCDGLGLVGSV